MIRCNMIIWLIEMDKYDMVYLTGRDKWTCYGYMKDKGRWTWRDIYVWMIVMTTKSGIISITCSKDL